MASLVALLLDPEDRAALAHVFESPLLGLDPRLLAAGRGDDGTGWWRWLHEPEAVPEDVPRRAEVVQRLSAFATFWRTARARSLMLKPGDLLLWLVNASGLRHRWQAQHERQALRDLGKLVALAHRWEQQQPGLGLSGYVARLRRQIDEHARESIPVEHAAAVVEVTTVHGAKGREWPIVFVADTALPSGRASQVEHVLWDEKWGLVISDGSHHSKSKAPDPLADLRRDLRRRARNEERAIWYVALTRARDRLVITHSRCEVDERGHFEDAVLAQDEASDRPVHFFHELWEHVRVADDPAGSIFHGPGPCSGAIAPAFQAVAERPGPALETRSAVRDAWNRALHTPSGGGSETVAS
jgi:ATP-dependent exoDNAse (exonuclease V) beta subunit